MAPEFIFMLTRDDRTVSDARSRLAEALEAGVGHIGFKDVGLPPGDLRDLARDIRAAGASLYLEVVSLDAPREAASARAAVELEVDAFMGGTRPEVVLPILAGAALRYYPFPGEVVGHPSRLRGDLDDIVRSAEALLAMDGIDGLDLLAYRFDGDAPELMRRVCEAAAGKPVIVAGSIDRMERIEAVVRAGAAAFTVGTAAFEGSFPCAAGLREQLAFIAGAVERATGGAAA